MRAWLAQPSAKLSRKGQLWLGPPAYWYLPATIAKQGLPARGLEFSRTAAPRLSRLSARPLPPLLEEYLVVADYCSPGSARAFAQAVFVCLIRESAPDTVRHRCSLQSDSCLSHAPTSIWVTKLTVPAGRSQRERARPPRRGTQQSRGAVDSTTNIPAAPGPRHRRHKIGVYFACFQLFIDRKRPSPQPKGGSASRPTLITERAKTSTAAAGGGVGVITAARNPAQSIWQHLNTERCLLLVHQSRPARRSVSLHCSA